MENYYEGEALMAVQFSNIDAPVFVPCANGSIEEAVAMQRECGGTPLFRVKINWKRRSEDGNDN